MNETPLQEGVSKFDLEVFKSCGKSGLVSLAE